MELVEGVRLVAGDLDCWRLVIVPQSPFICKGQVVFQEMHSAAVESAVNIVIRRVMAAQFHPQRHTLDRLRSGTDDDVMQQDVVPLRFCLSDQGNLGSATECALTADIPVRRPSG